jgi:uncharacterized SAM-binding protein YcdF (DUF218 family)
VGLLRPRVVLAALVALVVAPGALLGATGLAVYRAAHTDEARRVSRVDLIAVLGAAQYGGRPSPTFRGRLHHAALLYRKGFAPRIVVLGGRQPGDRSTEAEAGRAWLLEQEGIPARAVAAEPRGVTTLESLRAAARFMEWNGLRTVLLVSDPWHNLRVRRMARDLGLRAYVSATWHSAARSRWKRLEGYARETLAYLAYRLLGR